MDAVIVIVGGMGPMAGIECFKYVAENCMTNGTDQDNLNTVVISFPSAIENRVDFVLGITDRNPGESVAHFMKNQLSVLSESYSHIVIGVPCITFHCPSIFSAYRNGIFAIDPLVKIVSIVTSTVEFIKMYYPTIDRVGILSTDGTRHAKPFKDEFKMHDLTTIYLSDEEQLVITECIFNKHWGIKSMSFDKPLVHAKCCEVMDSLIEQGCQVLILGCTEIPLAISEKNYKGIPVLNPSWIMARHLIKSVDETKLKPF